ncbi:TAXI family TRAP transporter solute-binding subunit [Actinophytocola sp.]|uniref:TAXI family TRAP transporter solute-binding subunit n=1 Tax=Actinophytocola sp. TaxID=1872138 RepID=UPI002D7F92CF|nr:TAXI family TRAP transporter solute-binding subunit [Actinophytocola sp.]HET9138813.1 TAXI family TRAP transporter solute-binding subunit [Actinophytocola sp.]HEU5108865.1 TAXI family TRAP transporter solute-binding subunit [Micromonosporaceae bacterium]
MRTRKSSILAGIVAIGLIGTGCGGKRTDNQTAAPASGGQVTCEAADGRITIATGNTGGVYYTLGGGLAQLISANTKLRATAAETGASVQNIKQLVAGDYDLAFSLADTAADAVNGKGSFTSAQKVTALARIYSNYTHVMVRSDSGINSVADMRGKKISTGSANSGTEVIANRLLQAAGLDPAKDVQAQRLALRPTVDGMKAGQLDGLVWSGGLPTPEITDLTTAMRDQVRFIDITGQLDALKKINPVYDRGSIPAATYQMAGDTPTIVVPNMLLVREDFAANNACAITNLVFDKQADLVKVHPSAKELSRDTAPKTDPVPLHPGAKQALGVS